MFGDYRLNKRKRNQKTIRKRDIRIRRIRNNKSYEVNVRARIFINLKKEIIST